ncbi:MAG: trigger factor [Lachnospiraceae bacterium]|nr:trigger factor [Lachnospiraceae bacterium]
MSKEENTTSAGMSASKQKRVERQKKYDSEKRKKNLTRAIWYCIGAVIVVLACFFLFRGLYRSITKVKPNDDYSAGLAENGFIEGVTAADYVTVPDYKALKIAKADVEYSDEDVQKDIDSQLESHKELNEDTALEVKDGDTVNIDYVGTIDGEEFEGGNSNGSGYDLTIGSGSFIDDFEQQLIGSHPGDSVTVQVTFPEDYQSEELQGKDAEFAVDIHGIYELPEFDDAFVEEYLSENAKTVEEYKQYLKDTHYDENLEKALKDEILEESEVKKYPSYLKQAKSLRAYMDQESFEQMNQLYMSYYGNGFADFNEYTGMTDEEYQEDLDENVKESLKEQLVWQYILESEGISLTEQDYRDHLTEQYGNDDNFDSMVEEQGLPYLLSTLLEDKAVEQLKKYVTVE